MRRETVIIDREEYVWETYPSRSKGRLFFRCILSRWDGETFYNQKLSLPPAAQLDNAVAELREKKRIFAA
jgi:hypothetical protein